MVFHNGHMIIHKNWANYYKVINELVEAQNGYKFKVILKFTSICSDVNIYIVLSVRYTLISAV